MDQGNGKAPKACTKSTAAVLALAACLGVPDTKRARRLAAIQP